MKKLSLLPKAEKIPLNSYLYYAKEDIMPELNLKLWVTIIILVVWVVSWFYSPVLFAVLFGMSFITVAFNALRFSTGNALERESTIWKRISYVLVGVFCIIAGIAMRVELESDKGLAVFFMLLKWYFVVVFLTMGGRLIYIIACARAISKRKICCTERVIAEHDPFRNNIDKGQAKEFYESVYRSLDFNDPERQKEFFSIYRRYGYEYEDGFYRLMISEHITDTLADKSSIELFIDPQQPECFYTEWLEKGNKLKFRSWAWVTGFWVAAAAFAWWFASLGY